MGYPFTWTQSHYIWRRPFDMPTRLPLGDFYDNCGVCSNDPVAQGIFGGAGRVTRFTRGIFDEHPPYALPDYIMRESDGVDGIGNYEGFGLEAAPHGGSGTVYTGPPETPGTEAAPHGGSGTVYTGPPETPGTKAAADSIMTAAADAKATNTNTKNIAIAAGVGALALLAFKFLR